MFKFNMVVEVESSENSRKDLHDILTMLAEKILLDPDNETTFILRDSKGLSKGIAELIIQE